MRIRKILFIFVILITTYAHADSLSYSGRLVNTNGSPVVGPVNLKFDLVSTADTSTILCTQTINSVSLTNGVFHVKLDLDCGTPSLSQVLASISSPNAAAIRVTNLSASKVYSFQELHAVPAAQVAHGLSQLNANNNEVLTWTGSKWEPRPVTGATGGTVTDITAGTGLSGGTITNSGTISIANGGVTDSHLSGNISRSKIANGSANYVLVNNGSGGVSEVAQLALTQGGTGATNAADARTNLGLGALASMNPGLYWNQALSGDLSSCLGTDKLTLTAGPTVTFACVPDVSVDNSKLPLAGGTMSGPLAMGNNKITGLGAPTAGTDATTKTYVDTQVASSASKWTLSGNNISNNNSGNVSIGTTDPLLGKTSNSFTKYLSVTGSAGASSQSFGALRLGGNQPTAAAGDRIGAVQFTSVNNPDPLANFGDAAIFGMLEGAGGASGFGTSLSFWTRADNTTSVNQRMIISQNGNVGIGAGVPAHLLHMSSSSGHAGIGLNAPAANFSYLDFYRAGAKKANIFYNGTTDKFLINDVGSVDTIINGSGGNVGVGIVPSDKFEVGGNIAVNGKVRMKSDNTNYVELKAPNGLAATTTYTFPATAGTSGYVLTTDGAGALSWTQAATTATNVGGDLTGTIANAQIAPGAIYNADIANLTITYAKLNLLDGEVPVAKLAPIATITPSNTAIANGDSLTTIANKTQGQINNLVSTSSNYLVKNGTDSITGTVTVSGAGALKIPTTPSGSDLTDAANVQYVQNYVGTFGQWTKSGANLSYSGGSVGIGIANPWDQFMVYKANNVATASIVSDNTSTTTARYPSIAVKNFGGGGAGAIGNPVLELVNLRGNSTTSAVVKAGDTLGGISFSGSTNTSSAYKEGATIRAIASQNYSTTAAGGMLLFSTTPNSTTAPIDRMTIDQNGSVGIGTVAPTGLLHLNSTGGQMMLLTDSDSLHSDVNYSTYVRAQDYVGNNVWYIGDGSTTAKALNILTYQTGYPISFGTSTGTTMSVVDDKVGIGTTAPTHRLHIEQALNSAYVAKISNGGGDGQGLLINASDGGTLDTQPLLAVTNYDSSISMLHVQGNGNVGIGTTTPGHKLHVNGSFRVNSPYGTDTGAAVYSSSGGGYGQLEIGHSNVDTDISFLSMHSFNNTAWTQGIQGSSFVISNTSGATKSYNDVERFTITTTGNVGIGSTAPTYRLDVNGNIRGIGITDASDVRLKNTIVPLRPEEDLEKILMLNSVSYFWNDRTQDPDKQIGYIAQEMEKVYPELVETDSKGMKSVNYSHLVSPITNAIKALHTRQSRDIASLRTENEKLREENAKIKKENDEIKSRLDRLERALLKQK